jgi:hypothetical protein
MTATTAATAVLTLLESVREKAESATGRRSRINFEPTLAFLHLTLLSDDSYEASRRRIQKRTLLLNQPRPLLASSERFLTLSTSTSSRNGSLNADCLLERTSRRRGKLE